MGAELIDEAVRGSRSSGKRDLGVVVGRFPPGKVRTQRGATESKRGRRTAKESKGEQTGEKDSKRKQRSAKESKGDEGRANMSNDNRGQLGLSIADAPV